MFFPFLTIINADLLFVGITIAAIGILGLSVYYNDPKSATNRAFFFFALLTIAYGVFNYLNYQVHSPVLVLWFLRFTLFFAIWHAFSLFHLFYVFPERKRRIPLRFYAVLLFLVSITAVLTLTPFMFSEIRETVEIGQVSNPVRGSGMSIFSIIVIFLVGAGIWQLITKTRNAPPEQREPFRNVLAGTAMTFALIIIFNVILPVFFNVVSLIPLAPVFFLPFISATAYVIFRYRFLNVKIVATEILTFSLAVVTLFELLASQNAISLALRVLVFLSVLSFGILLIRSVRKEIQTREEIEELANKLRDVNQELERINQAKSDFISMASHQLKTPLSIIKGYISMTLEGTFGKITKRIGDQLQRAYISNERLIALVDDLLNLSRVEEGRMKYDWKQASIADVIQTIVNEIEGSASQKKLRLEWHPPKKTYMVHVDVNKIRNVLFNLIDNAVKYTQRGSITIAISQTDTFVRVAVTDTGRGIAPQDIQKLFTKFNRVLKGTASLNITGFGLGLYIARLIMEGHKGRIWAESEGLGKGSTFFVELPLVHLEKSKKNGKNKV